MITELLPWLNVLFVPCLGLLVRINDRLATLEEKTRSHGARIRKLDGIDS